MSRHLAILCLLATAACGNGKEVVNTGTNDTRPLMVYRMHQDHHDKVPVGLSEDRQHIISYPQPKDLWIDGRLALPTALANDHWLDNKGIGLNVGLLRLTYAEYAALDEVPPLAEMEAMLLDRDPLAFMCDCGTRAAMSDPAKELDALVRKGTLRERCKVLK